MPMTAAKVTSPENIVNARTAFFGVRAGGIRSLDALTKFGGGIANQNHDLSVFALRHTLASHGCCSRGKPGGRK
jgi:hypothetical protein